MKLSKKLPYINDSQQEIIIETHIKFYNDGYDIARDCLQKTGLNIESRKPEYVRILNEHLIQISISMNV